MKKLLIETQKGFGDNIYSRPFIKAKAKRFDLYLRTPFPQLYADLNVKFVKAYTTLRTQAKNINRNNIDYVADPICGTLFPRYTGEQLRVTNMYNGLKTVFGCEPESFDLPKFSHNLKLNGKPLCIVRPASLRTEWLAESRNPLPEYIYQAAEIAMKHYHVISIADIDGVHEKPVLPLPIAHEYYNSGELAIDEVMALIQQADLVIGGVGFIVPACIASNVNLCCILGGCGGYNAPEKITDPSMNLSKVHFIYPDEFCRCRLATHKCNKHISNFIQKFEGYINDITRTSGK